MNFNQNTLNIIFFFARNSFEKIEFENSQRVFAFSSPNKDEKFWHEILFSSKEKISRKCGNKFPFFFFCSFHARTSFSKRLRVWKFLCPVIYLCSFIILYYDWIKIWKNWTDRVIPQRKQFEIKFFHSKLRFQEN